MEFVDYGLKSAPLEQNDFTQDFAENFSDGGLWGGGPKFSFYLNGESHLAGVHLHFEALAILD